MAAINGMISLIKNYTENDLAIGTILNKKKEVAFKQPLFL